MLLSKVQCFKAVCSVGVCVCVCVRPVINYQSHDFQDSEVGIDYTAGAQKDSDLHRISKVKGEGGKF